ncbi:hypothetical protein BKA60DRAFT_588717 [Fusarium oxysporum]|nr:hypothetical protein BKA60DRAFT_588717 [Fusarium oxysporum]
MSVVERQQVHAELQCHKERRGSQTACISVHNYAPDTITANSQSPGRRQSVHRSIISSYLPNTHYTLEMNFSTERYDAFPVAHIVFCSASLFAVFVNFINFYKATTPFQCLIRTYNLCWRFSSIFGEAFGFFWWL